MGKYRTRPSSDIQLGPVLQEMTESLVPPRGAAAGVAHAHGKALAQMQLATAQLDPDLDPFDVAGSFLMRALVRDMSTKVDPKALFYQAQRFKVRFHRVVEAVERLIGARPGRRSSRSTSVRRRWRRRSVARAVGWRWRSPRARRSSEPPSRRSERVPAWLPVTFGIGALLLTLGLVVDLVRRRN